MNQIIQQELSAIEQRENIKILLAVESGSRAWGFASPDSDYDVRFIYIRPPEYYLRLDQTRDVIELPVSDLLDINGWDLKKALTLLHGSNPTLYEWFSSPIVYRAPSFRQGFTPLLNRCFSRKNCLHHYLNTAVRHDQAFLGGPCVRAKKYFYVLRPLLACRWTLEKGTPPPVLFSELCESQLSSEIKPYVDHLLDIKMNAPEISEIDRFEPVHDYIRRSIAEIRASIKFLPVEEPLPWDELNLFFLKELNLRI